MLQMTQMTFEAGRQWACFQRKIRHLISLLASSLFFPLRLDPCRRTLLGKRQTRTFPYVGVGVSIVRGH